MTEHAKAEQSAREPEAEHPATRTKQARDVFDKGHKQAEAWNHAKHLDCTDWRVRGEMKDGKEHAFLASATGGHDIPEADWGKK